MKKLLSTVILSIFLITCKAQAVGERITKTLVTIYNNSNTRLSVLLGDPSVRMDTFKLKENEVWYSPTYANDPVIKVQTQHHVTTYQLRLGNSYMIFWNTKKKYWDIKKTQNR